MVKKILLIALFTPTPFLNGATAKADQLTNPGDCAEFCATAEALDTPPPRAHAAPAPSPQPAAWQHLHTRKASDSLSHGGPNALAKLEAPDSLTGAPKDSGDDPQSIRRSRRLDASEATQPSENFIVQCCCTRCDNKALFWLCCALRGISCTLCYAPVVMCTVSWDACHLLCSGRPETCSIPLLAAGLRHCHHDSVVCPGDCCCAPHDSEIRQQYDCCDANCWYGR